MGRHSAPPTGDRDPRRPVVLAVAAAVVVLAVAVVGLVLGLRGDDEPTTTADPASSRTPSTSAPSSAALPSASGSGSASPSTSPTESTPAASTSASATQPSPTAASTTTKAARPVTLQLRWVGRSYVRVRVGGQTVFEGIRGKGTTRTFDQRAVSVLIGNAANVRATVNGKPRPPGGAGQIDSFTARR